MKKFDMKSAVFGFIIGTIGITAALTTVFATSGIRSANFSNARVYFYGQEVPLENQLVSIVREGESNARLYMPLRELLEYMNFIVEWDSETNSVNLTMRGNPGTHSPSTSTTTGLTSNTLPQNDADRRAISIIESSGTWSSEIDRLIPQMTPETVDRLVFTYLEKQLFPGISTSINAGTVAGRIEIALRHMTESGRDTAQRIISSYY